MEEHQQMLKEKDDETEIASKDKTIQERLNELKDENEHLRSDISNLTLQLQTVGNNKLRVEALLETANAKVNELQTKVKSLEEEIDRISSERKLEHLDVDLNFAEDTGFSSCVREVPVLQYLFAGEISEATTSTKRSSPPEDAPPNRFSRGAKRLRTNSCVELFGMIGHNEISQAILEKKDLNQVKRILKQGCNVGGRNDIGKTIVHLAVQHHNDPEVIRFLIVAGADVNLNDRFGNLPLHLLADVKHNFREKLMALCENGADINAKDGNGNTILHLAAYREGETEYIVKKGGGWTLRNEDDETVLHRATEGSHPEVKIYLIQIGMKVHEKDYDGSMPVHLAPFAKQNFSETKTLDVLLAHGAAINSTDKDGDTGLGLAALNSSRTKEDIEYIISKGGDLQARNVQGESVLDVAAVRGNAEVVNN